MHHKAGLEPSRATGIHPQMRPSGWVGARVGGGVIGALIVQEFKVFLGFIEVP